MKYIYVKVSFNIRPRLPAAPLAQPVAAEVLCRPAAQSMGVQTWKKGRVRLTGGPGKGEKVRRWLDFKI